MATKTDTQIASIPRDKMYPALGFRKNKWVVKGDWIQRGHFRHTHNQQGHISINYQEYGKQMKLATVDPQGLFKKIEELSSYLIDPLGYGPEGVYIIYRGSNSRYGLNKEETIKQELYKLGYVSDLKIKSIRTIKAASDKPFVRGEYFEQDLKALKEGGNGCKGKMVKGDRK